MDCVRHIQIQLLQHVAGLQVLLSRTSRPLCALNCQVVLSLLFDVAYFLNLVKNSDDSGPNNICKGRRSWKFNLNLHMYISLLSDDVAESMAVGIAIAWRQLRVVGSYGGGLLEALLVPQSAGVV